MEEKYKLKEQLEDMKTALCGCYDVFDKLSGHKDLDTSIRKSLKGNSSDILELLTNKEE